MRFITILALFWVLLSNSPFVYGFGTGINTCTPPFTATALVTPKIVGDGTPASCTDAAMQAALSGGGHIAFNCGTQPATITINSPLQIDINAAETVIDGGNLITLDGGNSQRILEKAWHDGGTTKVVKLQNIRLINGRSPSDGSNMERRGGAVFIRGPGNRFYAINSRFENNHTGDPTIEDDQGGAIYTQGSYEVGLIGSHFSGNTAGSGGAFGAIAAGLLVYNSRFDSNQAVDNSAGGVVRGHGGAIHLDGVTNNSNPNSNRTVQVCGSIFENNTATRGGGALKVTVSDNKGTKATYERSVFRLNRVTGTVEKKGGAIYHIEDDLAGGSAEDNFALLDSTFDNNRAPQQGGAVWVSVNGNAVVQNATFYQNSVADTALGMGGALAINDGNFTVINSTFAENDAYFHGAAIQATTGAMLTLRNSIFHYNSSERDWARYPINRAADVDGGGNIQFPATRFNQANTPNDELIAPSAVRADPLLTPLGNFGGPVPTMQLDMTSVALTSGNSCPPADARGIARGNPCSSGAYEGSTGGVQPANQAPVFTSTPVLAVVVGNVYRYQITAVDAEGDPIRFTALDLPAWLTLTDANNGTALLTGTPSAAEIGVFNIWLNAQDTQGAGSQRFTVTVSDSGSGSSNGSSGGTTQPATAACPDTADLSRNCNASGASVEIETIEPGGVLANAQLSRSVANQGWVIDVKVLPEVVLSGGVGSGRIENEGTIRDLEFRGATLSGGQLAGTIRNTSSVNGLIHNVQFAAGATLNGGKLGGMVQGDPVVPAVLTQVKIAAGAELSHVILGDDVTLDDAVTLAEGVRYQNQLACAGRGWILQAAGQLVDAVADDSCFQARNNVMVITTQAAHRGQAADLILVGVSLAAEAFSHDGNAWQTIPAEISEILPLMQYEALPLTVELPVNDLLMTDRTDMVYYFGYRLADGTIAFVQL